MSDLLVKLYELPPLAPVLAELSDRGVRIRRAIVPEKPWVLAWVRTRWPQWEAEVEAAFARSPVGCFIAQRDQRLTGFACHDATFPNFFGPEGVDADAQGQGIGRGLLLSALHAQREQGYAYSIIGASGPVAFYARTVGAVEIAGSSPGLYAGMLRGPA